MNNAITMLVGEELGGGGNKYGGTLGRVNKYGGTLAAPNGSVYGIPCSARRVSKLNPIDKSITHIGPDFGYNQYIWYEWKWIGGAITDSGIIYCPPCNPLSSWYPKD